MMHPDLRCFMYLAAVFVARNVPVRLAAIICPNLAWWLQHRLADLDGRVGVKNVNFPKLLDYLGKARLDLFFDADICFEVEDAATLRLDLSDGLGAGFLAAAHNNNMLTIASKKQRGVLADSRSSSRDDDYTIAQCWFPFR